MSRCPATHPALVDGINKGSSSIPTGAFVSLHCKAATDDFVACGHLVRARRDKGCWIDEGQAVYVPPSGVADAVGAVVVAKVQSAGKGGERIWYHCGI